MRCAEPKQLGALRQTLFRRDKLNIVSLRLAKSATTINPPHVKSAQWCGKISHYFEGPAGLSAVFIIFATKILCYIVLRVLSSGLKNKNFQKTCPLIGIPKRWLLIIGICWGDFVFQTAGCIYIESSAILLWRGIFTVSEKKKG